MHRVLICAVCTFHIVVTSGGGTRGGHDPHLPMVYILAPSLFTPDSPQYRLNYLNLWITSVYCLHAPFGRVADSPGLTRSIWVLAFDLRAPDIALSSGYRANYSQKSAFPILHFHFLLRLNKVVKNLNIFNSYGFFFIQQTPVCSWIIVVDAASNCGNFWFIL